MRRWRNGIVQHGGFSLLNDGHIAEDEDIYARTAENPPLPNNPQKSSLMLTGVHVK